jgi:hypothetical protein
MTATAGLSDSDARPVCRRDECQLSDDRLSPAQKLGFVHEVLRRDMAEVRMFLDHLEKYSASLGDAERQALPVSAALAEIAHDQSARSRYLEFMRDADDPAVRARMLAFAHGLGWLSAAEQRAEISKMFGERPRATPGSAEVDLACTLNKTRDFKTSRIDCNHRLWLPGRSPTR